MNTSKASSTRRPIGFFSGLQPALAWTAILGFILLSLACLIASPKVLNFVFPAGAFAVGIFLYLRYPLLYIGFSLWMWFLTPLVRRLADYRSSFTDPSPILLAPLLITFVSGATLWKYFPKIYRNGGLAFLLSFFGVVYGFLVGLVQSQGTIVPVVKECLEWVTPILFGFHLFANWQDYPSYRQTMQRVFSWAVLVMGIYGVYQYLVAPGWDQFWLDKIIQEKGILSFGRPAPLEIRVWSTMHGPLTLAVTMMAGLLLLFTGRSALRLPASGVGYLAFLLSQARTAWLGWIVGLLVLSSSLKPSLQFKLIITIASIALCVIPLTFIEPFADVIQERLNTLTTPDEDGSGQARAETYSLVLNSALTNWLGTGIGNVPDFGTALDSAVLSMFFALGVFGSVLYLSGWILALFQLFQSYESRIDPFASTARAIAIAGLSMFPLGSVIVGVCGVIIWAFLGIGLAANKYHLSLRLIGGKEKIAGYSINTENHCI